MKLSFLGDSHGFIPEKECFPDGPVFHVGDLGVGFGINRHTVLPLNFKFIRGNHDDPEECRVMPEYLGEFGVIPELSLGFISGAESRDKANRVEGVDWWRDEELSYTQFGEALAEIEKHKPDIILSHDGPSSLFSFEGSATRKNLEFLFQHVHQPKYWVYGHHHHSRVDNILGTNFIGLDINEFVTIEI